MQKTTKDLSFYTFFTKYSLMEDYGFTSGLISRLYKKILPSIPEEDTFEFFLFKNKKNIDYIFSTLDFNITDDNHISKDLTLSIKALCTKIAAFGLDSDILYKFNILNLNPSCFEILLNKMSTLDCRDDQKTRYLIHLLNEIENNINSLRKYKNKIGISLHLTIVTRRILEYIERVKELVNLSLNINSPVHWREIIIDHLTYRKKKYSLRRFIVRHLDLLIFEAVEHTSNKGDKYIAENNTEYRRFLYKSMLGGALIALFALFKIYFGSNYEFDAVGDAIIFSLNYAICFILVKQLGGIIATKQPAMTASTIAKHIDKNNNLQIDSIKEIIKVIKKALGSQFISLVGNFTMALLFASTIYLIFEQFGMQKSLGIKPDYLMKDIMPTMSLFGYAATAGVFLALSGIISGYVDNKVIASRAAHRIVNTKLFFNSKKIADFILHKGGSLMGNITLGFFLGSAFLLSYIFSFSIDIRHIAFSTSYLGYSIMSHSFEITTIIKALLGILIIGLTNLIVSFSITLLLALKSRGATLLFIPKLFMYSVKDFFTHPWEYFIVRDNHNNLKERSN